MHCDEVMGQAEDINQTLYFHFDWFVSKPRLAHQVFIIIEYHH